MSISISSGKVLDSLYKNQRGSSSFYTGIYSKTSNTENKSVTASLSTNADFRKAVRMLKNSDYGTGLRADIKKAVKQMVKSYNEFKDSKGDDSKEYHRMVSKMEKLFGSYSGELSKVGVSMTDGKLKFDVDKFDGAANEDLEKLFSSDSEFINETDKILKSSNRMIQNDQYPTVKEDVYVSNKVNSNNIAYANHANTLAVAADRLNKTVLTNDNMGLVVDMINAYTDKIAGFYEELTQGVDWSQVDSSERAAEDVNEIIRLNEDYIDAVQKSVEGEDFLYEDWFSEDENSYGSQVTKLYKDLFSELVNAGKKDFEINSFVDYTV